MFLLLHVRCVLVRHDPWYGSEQSTWCFEFSSKEAAARVEKLLRSAIANWEQKNERKAESGELFVTRFC